MQVEGRLHIDGVPQHNHVDDDAECVELVFLPADQRRPRDPAKGERARAASSRRHRDGTDAPHEEHVMTTQDNQPQKAPVQLLADILKDPNLTDEQKQKCETFLRVRFQNRRRMAWWSLVALLAVAAAKLFYEPARDVDVGWLTGPLVGIVGYYYGTTALRPGN